MPPTLPFRREAGSGPGGACLSYNASTSSQCALLEDMGPITHLQRVSDTLLRFLEGT